uniref:Uncharacterized protein n=1 Tax=Glossina morsitans morsitans TaxID=37546 RepID=A0A1A9YUH6_GLOMM
MQNFFSSVSMNFLHKFENYQQSCQSTIFFLTNCGLNVYTKTYRDIGYLLDAQSVAAEVITNLSSNEDDCHDEDGNDIDDKRAQEADSDQEETKLGHIERVTHREIRDT